MDRYSADTVALESLYPVIYHDNYENGWDREEITVYAVSKRAIVKFRSEAEHDLK